MNVKLAGLWRSFRAQPGIGQVAIVASFFIVPLMFAGAMTDQKKKDTATASSPTVTTAAPAATAALTTTTTSTVPPTTAGPTTSPPTTEPAPSTEPPPSTEPDPTADMKAAVLDALDGKAGVTFLAAPDMTSCAVRFTADDNITAGFIKKGIKIDVANVLHAVQKSGNVCDTVRVVVDTTLTTKLGEEIPDVVIVSADYARDTIRRIDFENFDNDDIFDPAVVESVTLHPGVWG